MLDREVALKLRKAGLIREGGVGHLLRRRAALLPVLSEPQLLFHREEAGFPTVAPDGERFLGLRKVEDAPLRPYTLVLNWPPQP
jgi:hypothetical protein